MPKPQRTADGRWRVRYDAPTGSGRQQRQRTFDTYEVADAFCRRVAKDKRTQTERAAEAGAQRFRRYADDWLVKRRQISESTRDRYRVTLEANVYPHIGNIIVSELQPADVDDLIETLVEQGKAAATVEKAVNVVKQVCDRAVRESALVLNPADKAEVPSRPDTEMLFLTPVEVERLAAQLGEHGLFFRFLCFTGLRWGEATALRGVDVDSLRARVLVDKSIDRGGRVGPTKTRNTRRVPLADPIRDDILALAAERGEGLLFQSRRGTPLHGSNFRRALNREKKQAGIHPGFRVHDTRHTCAAWLLAQSQDLWKIAKWLGHATPNTTTRVYGHLLDDGSLDDLAKGLSLIAQVKGEGPASIGKVTEL